MRSPFSDTVTDLLEAVVGPRHEPVSVRVTEAVVDVPMEVALVGVAGGFELLAHPPRWRWTTVYDSRPGRVRIRYVEQEVSP